MTPRKINPPHYFLLALVVMVGLRLLGDGDSLFGAWSYVGVVPVAAGVMIAMLAARQFARAGTNIIPLTTSTALVDAGMFAHTRNPMYLGMTTVLVGAALLLDRPLPWLVVPVFVMILRLRFIRHEERLMEATFGAAYTTYKQRVRRWV